MTHRSPKDGHAPQPRATPDPAGGEAAGTPRVGADAAGSPEVPSGFRGVMANWAVPFLLVVVALGIAAALMSSPPHVPKSDPKTLAPVVGVDELVPMDAEVFIDAFGAVVPAREIRIMAEVGGRILELNHKLEPGGLIAAGEMLLRIDPSDYDIAVAQAEADLQYQEHEVARIRAGVESLRSRIRQLDVEIAYAQWNAERLGRLAERESAAQSEAREAATTLDSQRAARRTVEAEIAEQEMAVESASASARVAERRLETAKLALARTRVTVPFDALVLSESVEMGQLVGPQTAVATLVATDEFWVEAAIPVARLQDVRFAEEDENEPSRVMVMVAVGGEEQGIARDGVALRPLGSLDPLGRMARVLISIRDPLGLADRETRSARRVLLGSYVRLRIESGTLRNVYSIPRKALRENDRIWVRDADGLLAIRPVRIVWRRSEDVLVRDGFEPGDRLVTTHLASVVPGIPLLVREEASSPGGGDAGDATGGAGDDPEEGGSNGAERATP